jgi:hypothetical protein
LNCIGQSLITMTLKERLLAILNEKTSGFF